MQRIRLRHADNDRDRGRQEINTQRKIKDSKMYKQDECPYSFGHHILLKKIKNYSAPP